MELTMFDSPRLPAAVLWDFDGTLVDSEPLWLECEQAGCRALGGELPDGFERPTIAAGVAS